MSAPRATWKGVLQISQVTIPIKVFPATETAPTLAFNQLHSECQCRIQQRKWCATCGREVTSAEIVKGYEFERGRYVLLLDAELDAVRPPSARVIEIAQFTPASALPRTAIDRAYYLAPDGPEDGPAAVAYAVLHATLDDQVGIGKLAIYGREYLVAIGADVETLVLHTLHHAAELREPPYLVPRRASARALPELSLASDVVAAMSAPLDLADFRDAYQRDVQRLIDAKIAGDEFVAPATPAPPAVANLHDALTASLKAVRTRPVKASRARRRRAS